MRRFYGHFIAAYGTCWFVLLVLATITMSHINTGAFGYFGFPIISAIYAFVRMNGPAPRQAEINELQQKILELKVQLHRMGTHQAES